MPAILAARGRFRCDYGHEPWNQQSAYNFAAVALPSGTRIGVYEVVAPLGSGGMGEVYRARDTTLGRVVAIKVLLPEFSDAARLERFEREARVLAALNHPHVGAIYEVEDFGGSR